MNTADPDAFKALLESASSDSDGLILDSIIHDFDRFLEKKREFSHDFWRIIVFCRWMKVFHVESDLKSGLRS